MRCPYCKSPDSDRVVDSRTPNDGSTIRRRRACDACGRRFTTYERVEVFPLRVVKKDGRRVPFDRKKILSGMFKACEKRSVPSGQIDQAVDEIERSLVSRYEREVPSRVIGELIMDRLKELDKVAYVRFASVYREFQDTSDFTRILDEIHVLSTTIRGPGTRAKETPAKRAPSRASGRNKKS